MAEYCAQHTRQQSGVEGLTEREVGPHHSGKETIGDVILSGSKRDCSVKMKVQLSL